MKEASNSTEHISAMDHLTSLRNSHLDYLTFTSTSQNSASSSVRCSGGFQWYKHYIKFRKKTTNPSKFEM